MSVGKKIADTYICLPSSFYDRPTVTVARDLLGQLLVRKIGNELSAFEIVEVEAYTADDPACHAFGGLKDRCAVMFGPPGYAYVYFIYGMYHCLNVVTEQDGIAGAVLFRALSKVRGSAGGDMSGPGKLCRELAIDRSFNGMALFDAKQPLFLAQGRKVSDDEVEVTTRIGITKAADRLWRFHLKDNKSVSKRRKS